MVKRARHSKAWTVKQFIEQLGRLGTELSPTYVTKIEVHGEIPNPELICKIADVLNLNQSTLLDAAKKNKARSFEQENS